MIFRKFPGRPPKSRDPVQNPDPGAGPLAEPVSAGVLDRSVAVSAGVLDQKEPVSPVLWNFLKFLGISLGCPGISLAVRPLSGGPCSPEPARIA